MKPPVVFMHYGDSPYLRQTLDVAARFNTDRRVVLLGDDANAKYGSLPGVEHLRLTDYLPADRLEGFNRSFQYVVGTDFEANTHRGAEWVRFNLTKWFILDYFVRKESLERFWTFDSDTLVVENLASIEPDFAGCDYTVMNRLSQLQGLVNDPVHIGRYCEKVIEVFGRDEILSRQRRELESTRKGHALTMMAFWDIYQRECRPRTTRLGVVRVGRAFDECVSIPGDYESVLLGQRPMKALYHSKQGRIFGRLSSTGEFVRFWGLNMSWQPAWLIHRLARLATRATAGSREEAFDATPQDLRRVSLAKPMSVRLGEATKRPRYWLCRYPVLVWQMKARPLIQSLLKGQST